MEYIDGLVSVVIPTHRRSDTLLRAIMSVFNQTYTEIECIVVNDNEKNDEYSIQVTELLRPYIRQKRILFLEQPKHVNGAVARNYGIMQAHGEYIAFLDDDDWWMPNKIERQVNMLKASDKQCGGVSCLVEFRKKNILCGKTSHCTGGYIYKEILGREVDVPTSSLLLKRKYLDDTGYFNENLSRHQELQMLVFFTYKYKLEILPEYLLCMNLDDNTNRPQTQEQIRKIKSEFFEAVNPIFLKLSKKDKIIVEALNRMDIIYICLKQKDYIDALKEFFKILLTPVALINVLKRYIIKKQEHSSKFLYHIACYHGKHNKL